MLFRSVNKDDGGGVGGLRMGLLIADGEAFPRPSFELDVGCRKGRSGKGGRGKGGHGKALLQGRYCGVGAEDGDVLFYEVALGGGLNV